MIELPIIEAPEAVGAASSQQRFWRSFAHLRKDPGFAETAQHEFLPGAADPPSGASRRQFLQLLGASMAMTGLAACRRPVETILPYAQKPEEIIPGIPLFYATAMPFRGVAQPLLVESHEGRPTKIEGNPQHPSAQGATGLFEQASILTLYDPDRSATIRRDGDAATWGDFVAFCGQFAGGAAGKRVVVLSEETSSPTVGALRQRLGQTFGPFEWITYRAEGDDAVTLGMQQAFGSPYRPRYDFSQAQVIVSLDADFLGSTARDFVHATRSFAQGRRLSSAQDTMSRLYVAESAYSITGGMADHRKRLRSSEVPAFAAALAARLGVGNVGRAGGQFDADPYLAAVAADLQAAGAQAVVLAGETQPPAVHALCAAINSALGSVGTVMTLLDTGETPAGPQADALAQLVQAMSAGAVDALVIVGANPVYDAPPELNFRAAMQQVPETIHVGLHLDETGRAARWHVPRAHYLEAWGDARAYDGTLSVIQPLIAPLYADAHSEIEVFSALATGQDRAGYDLVRETWRGATPPPISGAFEEGWRRVLHDGFVPGTAYPTATASAQPVSLAPPAPAAGLEVVIRLDPTVFDGQYANNAWCQELPDPVTKIVWDNVAVMSPQTALDLGVSAEYSEGRYYVDVIRLAVDGRGVELPVWILPGHADGSISVTMGYGRDIASNRDERPSRFWDTDSKTDVYAHGALATGIGQNVAVLRGTDAAPVRTGVQAEPTGQTYRIITTQDHGTLDVEARPLFRMATYDEYRQDPDFVVAMEEPTPGEAFEDYPTLWENRHPAVEAAMRDSPYYRNQWGMVIDLNTCTGCGACVVACQSENNVQVVGKDEVANGRELSWLRLDRYFISHGDETLTENPKMVLQPMPCQHCENAPCESVCPVAATVHSPDGTNQMIYNRCIGTRYCANNCPYKVRRFNYFNWSKTIPETVKMAQNPNVSVRFRGVMEKCSFCIQRVRGAQKRAKLEDRALADGEVVSACQQACPAQAITFGDLNDPDSAVSTQKQNSRNYTMLAELNIKPRVSYLARVQNANASLGSDEV